MHNKKLAALALIAMANDGTTYRIERRSRIFPGDETEGTSFYFCLPDGQQVWWVGNGCFQLGDGRLLKIVGSQYRPV